MRLPIFAISTLFMVILAHGQTNEDVLRSRDPDTLKYMRKIRDMRQSEMMLEDVSGLTCKVCLVLAEFVSDLLERSFTHEAIAATMFHSCVIGKLYPPEVCKLAISEWQETFFWIADHTAFQPKDLCGLLFYPRCGSPVFPPSHPWNVTFPNVTRPPYAPLKPPPAGSPTLRVLFLTDFHVDPFYATGSAVDCGYPLCCRDLGFGIHSRLWPAAAPWGSIGRCDVPPRTLEDMLKHASKEKFDLIFFTGDIPPHDVYNQTISSQLQIFNMTHKLLAKYFPNTPVLCALGNHESNPVDQYIPPFAGPGESANPMQWLYSSMIDFWKTWLPESTFETIRKGGYWSWDIYPKLRVISLNSNYGSNYDWYMWFFDTDVGGQMQWLVDQLQEAETNKMRVWILCHHPDPGVFQFKTWLDKIVKRYAGSISAFFYGHSHMDEFRVYYDVDMANTPVLVGRVGPGLTGYHDDGGMNFGYQVLTIDGNWESSTFAVLDIESRFLNLTETKETATPVWRSEYSMRDAFNMTSLFPADYDKLIGRMKSDNQSASLYNYYKYKSSREKIPCTETCLTDLLSTVVQNI